MTPNRPVKPTARPVTALASQGTDGAEPQRPVPGPRRVGRGLLASRWADHEVYPSRVALSLLLIYMLLPTLSYSSAQTTPEEQATILDLHIASSLLTYSSTLGDGPQPESKGDDEFRRLVFLVDSLPLLLQERFPKIDGWGHDYLFRVLDSGVQILSRGQDGLIDPSTRDFMALTAEAASGASCIPLLGDDILLVSGLVFSKPQAQRNCQNITMSYLRALSVALTELHLDEDQYPGPTDGLVPVQTIASRLQPEHIRRVFTLDAWGNPILYWSDRHRFFLVSRGADGIADEPYTDLNSSPGVSRTGMFENPEGDITIDESRRFVSWPAGRDG